MWQYCCSMNACHVEGGEGLVVDGNRRLLKGEQMEDRGPKNEPSRKRGRSKMVQAYSDKLIPKTKICKVISQAAGDHCQFLKCYDKEFRFGNKLTDKQKNNFRLTLFIFRKAASIKLKAPTSMKGLECRFQFKSANPKPCSWCLPCLSLADMTVQSELTNAMLKAGVIEYADSEWSTGVVIAKKKGTTNKRYAVDYRGLNQDLMNNVIGVPRIDDLLDHWDKPNLFSTFDLASAFRSLPMRKFDKTYTAFHAYCDGGFQQY